MRIEYSPCAVTTRWFTTTSKLDLLWNLRHQKPLRCVVLLVFASDRKTMPCDIVERTRTQVMYQEAVTLPCLKFRLLQLKVLIDKPSG